LERVAKKDEAVPDPLFKRWYLYKIKRIYTDKSGNPHPDFKSRSDVVNDRELFMEFRENGDILTNEGNGTYYRTGKQISDIILNNEGSYQYAFQGDMLILSDVVEGITYTEKTTFSMKAL